MKTNLLALFIFLFLYWNTVSAQQISIKDIDESGYPFINVTIELPGNVIISFSQLQIIENNERTAFKVDSGFYDGQRTMLSFLVDETLLTSPVGKRIVSATLINASERLENHDLLNVILTGSEDNAERCMTPLSLEFTSDFKGLISQFETGLLTGVTSKRVNDLSCAIDKSIDFIQRKSAAPSQKYLIALKSRTSNISEWSALKSQADAHLIKLSKIELNFEPSGQNEQEVLAYSFSQLDSMQLASVIGNPNLKSYLLSFYTKQPGKLNTFKLKYNNQEIEATFKKPEEKETSNQNLIFIIIIALLFLLSIILAVNMLKLKKKSSKIISKSSVSKSTRLEHNKNAIAATSSPKKTNYGSITPYLTIELEGQIEKFDLKKLRTTIGRHSDNDILIANLTISNHHATITNEGGVFYIQDNDSTNGTFVNDIKITKSVIQPEDSVRLGKAKLHLAY